jgi:hypothetical protein
MIIMANVLLPRIHSRHQIGLAQAQRQRHWAEQKVGGKMPKFLLTLIVVGVTVLIVAFVFAALTLS